MKIGRVQAHFLDNIPITSPPFRELPSVERSLLVEIETSDGIIGWANAGFAHPLIGDFINRYLSAEVVGEDPEEIQRVLVKLTKMFASRFGRVFRYAVSGLEIALWDIKGKALGRSVHQLLGGAVRRVPVYITHGAAYGDAPVYSVEELAAEAAHLVGLGNRHLKNTVGRQASPDPDDDYIRMKAIRDAVGPEITLAMDAERRMSGALALRLCKLTEDLNIHFFEEPVLQNDPKLLAELRSQTIVPIAAAETPGVSCRDLLCAGAVDIMQPNANNDGGYTAGAKIASMAELFNVPIGHGNGSGPHNIALQAGVPNGGIVEYHFHKWMLYNAVYENVPQPDNGFVTVLEEPGTGLNPKAGLISEHKVIS